MRLGRRSLAAHPSTLLYRTRFARFVCRTTGLLKFTRETSGWTPFGRNCGDLAAPGCAPERRVGQPSLATRALDTGFVSPHDVVGRVLHRKRDEHSHLRARDMGAPADHWPADFQHSGP